MAIELIGSDLDGTLLDKNGKVGRKTREAIIEVRRVGIKFFIATGRSISRVEEIAKYLEGFKYDEFIVCLNGAKIYRYFNDSIELKATFAFTEDEVKFIMKKATEAKVLSYGLGVGDQYGYANRHVSIVRKVFDKVNGIKSKYYDGTKLAYEGVSKFILYGRRSKITKLMKTFNKKGYEMFIGQKSPNSKYIWVDITAKSVNKLSAIKYIAKEYNFDKSQIAFFGDAENDIPALKWVSDSYAMQNAEDNIKEIAKFRAKSNDDEGLVEPIWKYINERKDLAIGTSNTQLVD